MVGGIGVGAELKFEDRLSIAQHILEITSIGSFIIYPTFQIFHCQAILLAVLDSEDMDVEKVLESVGEFGLYQQLLCIFFIPFTTFSCGVNYYTQIFILATPSHTCGGNSGNITAWSTDGWNTDDSRNRTKNIQGDSMECEEGWVYDYSSMFPTITSQVQEHSKS